MQLYDAVDALDQLVGQTTKEEAHRMGIWHRVVAVFVFDTAGRLLVQEHLASNGLWDHSVGGHVYQGESYQQAAERTIVAELGLKQKLEFVSVFKSDERFKGTNICHIFGLFKTQIPDTWIFHPHAEVQRVFPLPLDTLIGLMNRDPAQFTGGFLHSMSEYCRIQHLPWVIKAVQPKMSVEDND